MDISQRFNDLTKEKIRDLMYKAVFSNTNFPKEKIIIEEYYNERVRGSVESWLNDDYLVSLPNIELVFVEDEKLDILVDLIVDACHEATHINQKEFYAKSQSKTKISIFEDSVANDLWKKLKEARYPQQPYELDARKHSFRLAFNFLKENLDLNLEEQIFFAKKLFFNFYEYETSKKIDEEKAKELNSRLDLVSPEKILEIINEYFDREIEKSFKEPYVLKDIEHLKMTPEADNLINKMFSSKAEQNLEIIKSFGDLQRFPYKAIVVQNYVKSSEKLCRLLKIEPEPSLER